MLEKLGSLGELVSAIAVLITLIYLAVQIRLNKQAISSQTLLVAMQNFNAINQGIVADAEVARIYDKGINDPDSLSEAEATRFFMIVRQVVNQYMSMFWLHRDGVLSDERWRGLGFDLVVNLPGIRRYFEENMHILEPEFVAWVRETAGPSTWTGVGIMRGGRSEQQGQQTEGIVR